MSGAVQPPEYKYVAYIDEAGDTGLKRVKPLDPKGASEWLILSAVVIKAEREAEVAGWIGDLMAELRSRQMRDLHFNKLSPGRKLVACQHVASLPVRCFVVAANKQNMQGYRNFNAEKVPSNNWFYCWLSRLLLERVTHWIEHRSIADYGEHRYVKLVFSERGGLSYAQMNAYYEWLKRQGNNAVLKLGNLSWPVVHRQLLEVHNHAGHDGLKLPDITASAFFKAADIYDTGGCDPQFAKALGPRMARWPDDPSGLVAGYGLKLMPVWKQFVGSVQPAQREVFKHYGYPRQWWSGGGP